MATNNKNPGSQKKESKARTIFVWAFDLSYLIALVWFFHVPSNQSLFWNTIGSWACNGVSAYVDWRLQQNPAPSNPVPVPVQVQKVVVSAADPSTAKGTDSEEYAPPPEFFQPPPLMFDPQEHEVKPAPPSFDPRPQDDKGRYISRIKNTSGKGIKFEKKKLKGVPFYLVTVDLTDPKSFLQIVLPGDAAYANSREISFGHENFDVTIKKHPCAAAINGTFFSKDAEERVMGNMVSEGKILKYSQWEDYGTTLGLRTDNVPEMITARVEGQPDWRKHWFSLTCGPRLLKQGEVWVNPEQEGFMDSHVLGIGPRSAIGFDKSGEKLFIVNFLRGLSLTDEARLMKSIGCHEAMNLDGGASKALAYDGKIIMKAGRGLTNVLVIYDSKHNAPPHVVQSWKDFQETGSANEYIPIQSSKAKSGVPQPKI